MDRSTKFERSNYHSVRQSYLSLLYFFVVLLTGHSSFAQARAGDHHYPATRNAFHNSCMQAYIYHEVGSYITQSYDYIYVLKNFYNTNYLFHEPISWAMKVNRFIDLEGMEEDYDRQLGFLFQNYQISLFRDTAFQQPYASHEVDSLRDSIGIDLNGLVLRENWYFHPEIKGFKKANIAVGLLSKKGKILAWYPYGPLRTFLLQVSDPFGGFAQMDEFLNSGLYPTSKLKTSNTLCSDAYAVDGFGNEFEALFEVAEFANRVRYWESLPKAERKKRVPEGVEYQLNAEKMLNGAAQWPSFVGQGICSQQFELGLASGSFQKKKEDQILISASFRSGLRHGKFESFYEDGQARTTYYFKSGLQDSIQRVWHSNGKLRFEYMMSDGEMNGKYESFLEDGHFHERGQFERGYVTGEWKYHIPLIHYFCYYMNETSFEWTIKDYIREDAFKDCTMDLEMYVEKKYVKGCPGGFCLIAHLKEDIR